MPKYLTETEVAEITRQSVHTLRQNRCKGIGIPYIKNGRSVIYREDDVTSCLEALRVETTAVNIQVHK